MCIFWVDHLYKMTQVDLWFTESDCDLLSSIANYRVNWNTIADFGQITC